MLFTKQSMMDAILDCISSSSSTSSLWGFLFIISVSFFLMKRLSSPIAKIPGPFLTKLSVLPIVYQDHISNRTRWTKDLHERYGPIVRLSPKEVSVSSTSSIRYVFTGSSRTGYYSKAPMFNIFQHFGARNAFSSIRSEDHSWRRRVVAGNYAQTAIVAKEVKRGDIWGNVGKFVEMVEREGISASDGGKAFDIFSACRFFAADNVSSHLFSKGSESLKGDEEIRRWIEESAEGPGDVLEYSKMEVEGLHRSFGWMKRTLGLQKDAARGRSRAAAASGNKVETGSSEWYGGTPIRDWGWKKFLATKAAAAKGGLKASTDGPVAAQLATDVIAGDNLGIPDEFQGSDTGIREVSSEDKDGSKQFYYRNEGCASECMDQFLAGLDTVGDTLAYILHLLSSPENHPIQTNLSEEASCLDLPLVYGEPLAQNVISNIVAAPWIDAVLKETLRLYPASTTAFQRVVPDGGRILDDYCVPGGTIVGGTPVTVNNDSMIFGSDVHAWRPERWLEASNVEEMNRRLWTFGSGGRGCIGRHFAMLEMKLLIAGIYSTFATSVDDETQMPLARNHPGSRTTFRDMDWLKEARGILRFKPISS